MKVPVAGFVVFLGLLTNSRALDTVVNICENEQGTLACSVGTIIKVKSANWGRKSTSVCTNTLIPFTTGLCDGTDITTDIRNRCNNQNSCTIQSSTSVWGNPCFLSTEYLAIVYYCDNAYNTTIGCNNQPVQVSCPSDYSISMNSCTFGRTSLSTCPTTGANPSTTCVNDVSQQCRAICNGKQSCTMVSAAGTFSGFTDTCASTEKYLQATSVCVPNFKELNICYNQIYTLACNVGQVINVLSCGYGRLSPLECPVPTIFGGTTTCNNICTTTMKSNCEGRDKCDIINNNRDTFGKSCSEVKEPYIKLKYRCVSP